MRKLSAPGDILWCDGRWRWRQRRRTTTTTTTRTTTTGDGEIDVFVVAATRNTQHATVTATTTAVFHVKGARVRDGMRNAIDFTTDIVCNDAMHMTHVERYILISRSDVHQFC